VDEEGPSRWDVLMRNRARLAIALLLILLAAMVAVGSTAVFTSGHANPHNTFSSGKLEVTGDDAAILTADRMVPGDSVDGTGTVQNTGSVPGAFGLASSDLEDSPGPSGGRLSEVLRLQIVEPGPSPQTIYDGRFDSMSRRDLGSWGPGEEHTYDFKVTFPEGGAGDNAYQGSSASITFTWDAVSE
jgi:spore coat-associated protein N